jgi:hypothetical protein
MTTDANDGVPIFEDEGAARLVSQDFDHEHNEAGRYAYAAMSEGWTAERLNACEVLHSGQADDCHFDDGERRIWLSRTGIADGEPFENTVTVEVNRGGSWVSVAKYDGGELEESDETLSGTFTLSISLGNAEMCEPEHVAAAVESLAERLMAGDEAGNVYDANGNTVGSFKYDEAA